VYVCVLDSTVLAHVLKVLNERYKYGVELTLLSVDEGIRGYRDFSLEVCWHFHLQLSWDSEGEYHSKLPYVIMHAPFALSGSLGCKIEREGFWIAIAHCIVC
jgi:hypothetical protein